LLIVVGINTLCPAASDQKTAFLRALVKQDRNYDPNEAMLRTPFSSPGYHTTLKQGTVHRTRRSLSYAVALLDAHEPGRQQRAERILERVIDLQDQDPQSRTYGIWSWFLEEPLSKMSPPDWNWADFCGTQLLQVALDHMDRLPVDLQAEIRQAILHAAYAIKKRNVGPGYTNIAIMGTYVTLVAGEQFNVPELLAYGKARLQRFHEHTVSYGSFSEYNSPTYTCVAITELTRLRQHLQDRAAQKLIQDLNRRAWYHLARHFHVPTRQWAGPHSRSYATLLRPSALAFIQRGTRSQVRFLPEAEAYETLEGPRIQLQCPTDLHSCFTDLAAPRVEIETFVRKADSAHDIIGTTYLHPDYSLGSVNLGDLWHQRRPLLAYGRTDTGVLALRLRCLHDDYDYASASLFTVQHRGDVLGAVAFATDRGDTHISLDRIKEASIRARDLRIRLQFEGDVSSLQLPASAELGRSIEFSGGTLKGRITFAHGVFGDSPLTLKTGQVQDSVWIDLALYSGPEKTINFAQINEAVVAFTLSLDPTAPGSVRMNQQDGRLETLWQRDNGPVMSLTVPGKPMRSTPQKAACSARLGQTNPWKEQ